MKLTELKRIAEQATPGPWQQSKGHREYRNNVIQTSHITRDVWKIADCWHDGEVDAAFISAFNPALALELIGLIEQAKEMAQYVEVNTLRDHNANIEARSFLEALRTWEDGR